MTTGYTQAVRDGKITTLHDYLKQCAHAFVPAMRDTAVGSDIPEISDAEVVRHRDRIAQCQAELDRLIAVDAAELERERDAEAAERIADMQQAAASYEETRGRYESLLQQVTRWEAPTELSRLREFMAQQLRDSITYDCDTTWVEKEMQRSRDQLHQPIEEYRQDRIATAHRMLGHVTTELADVEESYRRSVAWRATLMQALHDTEQVPA